MEPSKPPRIFISYSWESEDHKSWVRHLGERLYEVGIEARLDQWFVQPGESFTAFMEQEVAAADFVLVVCTPTYARKSNNRQGGVGYEQQIVSGQLSLRYSPLSGSYALLVKRM
jgi:TIR domain